MSTRCDYCKVIKPDTRDVRGDVEVEPLALFVPELRALNVREPLNLCEGCIIQLIEEDADDETGSSVQMPESESLSSRLVPSQSLSQQQQPQGRTSPDSTALTQSQQVQESDSLTSGEKESQQPNLDSLSSTSSFKRPLDDSTAGTGQAKRFKSNALNDLFSRPMPENVRQKKFAEIQNIPPEDLKDQDVLALWYYNRMLQQPKRTISKAARSNASKSSSNRSNSSIASNNSRTSAYNSLSRPLVQQSPPMVPAAKKVPPKSSRTTQPALVDIPEAASFYSSSSESDRSVPEQPQMRPPPPPPAPKPKTTKSKGKDDGNDHSNVAAPRRVRYDANSLIQSGHKNNGG